MSCPRCSECVRGDHHFSEAGIADDGVTCKHCPAKISLEEYFKTSATIGEVVPAPRYDDVYVEGVAWLDSLADEPTA